VARALENVAKLYGNMGRDEDARKCEERAAEIRKKHEEREKKSRAAQPPGGKP